MDEHEANRIAEAIRQSKLLNVIAISRNSITQCYEVRCDYTGPTLHYQNSILVGGISLWIKSPGNWAKQRTVLEHGMQEEK